MLLEGYHAISTCKNPLEVKVIRLDNYDLESSIRFLKSFTNLEEFYCRFAMSKIIPKDIFKLTNLKVLSFSESQLSEIPPSIIKLDKLEQLNLAGNNIKEIPDFIQELKQLQVLDLGKNPMIDLVPELANLKNLRVLIANSLSSTSLPIAILEKLSSIEVLLLPRKLSTLLQKKHKELYLKVPYVYTYTPLERKYFSTLARQLQDGNFDGEFKALAFNLLADEKTKLEKFVNQENLLKILSLHGLEVLRLKALEYLSKAFDPSNRKALAKNAKVVVQGKLGINKNELRAKLKKHNIRYGATIDADTTHFLIGQLPDETVLKEAMDKGLYLLTEDNIIEYWENVEQPYLLEESEAAPLQEDALGAMLLSANPDSIAVALTMFKEGGFPRNLISELFIAYKSLEEGEEAKKDAERLLRLYGSADLVAILKKEYYLFLGYVSNEVTVKSSIRFYDKNSELDGLKLAKHLLERRGIGKSYLLQYLPIEEQEVFIRQYCYNDGVVNLSGLGIKSIPKVLSKFKKELKGILLTENGMLKIPTVLATFESLVRIDLRKNYALSKEMEDFKALQKALPNCKISI